MKDVKAHRLVFTSANPIVADRPRLLVAVLRSLFAAPYADMAEMEQIVRSSELAWIVARVNRLKDVPPTGKLSISRDLSKPSSISRADVAATLIDLAESDTYARTAINIGGL